MYINKSSQDKMFIFWTVALAQLMAHGVTRLDMLAVNQSLKYSTVDHQKHNENNEAKHIQTKPCFMHF